MQDRAVASEIGYLWCAGDLQFLQDSVKRSQSLVDQYGALSLEDVPPAIQDAPTVADSEVLEWTVADSEVSDSEVLDWTVANTPRCSSPSTVLRRIRNSDCMCDALTQSVVLE